MVLRTKRHAAVVRRARLARLCLLAAGPAVCLLLGARAAAAADAAPRPGEVTLPLKDYLALVDSAERADARRQAAARQDPTVAAVVAQHTAVRIARTGGPAAAPAPAASAPPAASTFSAASTASSAASAGSAASNASTASAAPAASAASPASTAPAGSGVEVRFSTQLQVLVQGRPKEPVALPSAGLVSAVEVLPAAGRAAAAGSGPKGPGLYLVTPEPGSYSVRARSAERVDGDSGVSRVVLPAIFAPVAAMDVELPADLAWECAAAVVIDERVEGGRRFLRLSARRGAEPILVLRQAVAGDQAAELLVQDVVATLLQLRPEGLRRHDVILYEVKRGGLADLVVELPPGLEVERAATDEGQVTAVTEGNLVIVHRRRRLQGSGYLVLSSRPEGGSGLLPLATVAPRPAPRARYLAVAATVPGSLAPRPAAAWTRVDLDDLPAPLQGALGALDTTAAWRLTADAPGAAGIPTPALAVEWSAAPQAAVLETVVQRRLTTTLLTTDGTLLHRDSFELAQAGAVLALELPAGATLWSAAIDGQAVRPLQRGSRLDVPLGGGAHVVEVVEVLERVIARGRSRLSFDLAQVAAPVIEHRWRLLLPESARYRFAGGPLPPVTAAPAAPAARPGVRWVVVRDPWTILQSTPGVLTDRLNVGGNESGQGSAYFDLGAAKASGLAGRVTDWRGAALPGATVSLTPEDGPRLVQVSGRDGRFSFDGVRPGTYVLRAELAGFSPIEERDVPVEAGAPRGVELTLGNATEDAIAVTAESPLLDERRISVGATVQLSGDLPTRRADANEAPPPASPQVLKDLRNGLVGGVRPLPIAVPESGKALLLAGVLPPPRVTLDLEVRADRR